MRFLNRREGVHMQGKKRHNMRRAFYHILLEMGLYFELKNVQQCTHQNHTLKHGDYWHWIHLYHPIQDAKDKAMYVQKKFNGPFNSPSSDNDSPQRPKPSPLAVIHNYTSPLLLFLPLLSSSTFTQHHHHHHYDGDN